MKHILSYIIFLVVCIIANAQQVIPVSGGSANSTTGSLSYTVGQTACQADFEPAVSVLSVTASINEGVQQPFLIEQVSIPNVPLLSAEVNIFPNPTSNNVNVNIAEGTYNYTLFDINGKKLQSGPFTTEIAIQMASYASGSYLLDISDEQGHKNVYKIIKR